MICIDKIAGRLIRPQIFHAFAVPIHFYMSATPTNLARHVKSTIGAHSQVDKNR